jgi:2-dehydro-3-deoxygluconokinase
VKTFDVIALGETMISLAAPIGTSLAHAPAFEVDVAGAESNACIGLARSGLSTAWVSRVGNDPFGDRILQTLAAEGVDTRWAVRDDQNPTGLMVKDQGRERPHYYRSRSAARLLAPEALDRVPVEAARCVLVTGVTALISESAGDAALELLRRGGGVRAFDPNLRPGVWGSARAAELCLPLLEACSILIGGVGEIRELVGGDTLEETAQLALERGPGEVVLKQAAVGASALSREGGWVHANAAAITAVDPIGAGDAFNAGYLASRLGGRDIREALARGVECGSAVAASAGDWNGFPRSRSSIS